MPVSSSRCIALHLSLYFTFSSVFFGTSWYMSFMLFIWRLKDKAIMTTIHWTFVVSGEEKMINKCYTCNMLYWYTTLSECVTVNDNSSDTIAGNLSDTIDGNLSDTIDGNLFRPNTLSFKLWVLLIICLILLCDGCYSRNRNCLSLRSTPCVLWCSCLSIFSFLCTVL